MAFVYAISIPDINIIPVATAPLGALLQIPCNDNEPTVCLRCQVNGAGCRRSHFRSGVSRR